MKRMGSIFLTVISLGFTGWLYVQFQFEQNPVKSVDPQLIDAFMKEVTVRKFDQQGELQQTLHAKKVTHIPHNNASHITQPHLTLHRAKEEPWRVTAELGYAEKGVQITKLYEKVKIEQPAGLHNLKTTIKTSELFYQPKQHLLYTNKTVQLEQPGLSLKSIGMKAWLDQGKVMLLSKAQAHIKQQKVNYVNRPTVTKSL